MDTDTKTRDIPTTAVNAVSAVLLDLGLKIIKRESTPGACGYTRITYTI